MSDRGFIISLDHASLFLFDYQVKGRPILVDAELFQVFSAIQCLIIVYQAHLINFYGRLRLMNLLLHYLDRIIRIDFDGDCLANECLDKELHI